jgi:hypothetical protein
VRTRGGTSGQPLPRLPGTALCVLHAASSTS